LATRLNKKILCFVDETGTPGANDFSLGSVMLLASEAGRFDKLFTDLLETNAKEFHANSLSDAYLQNFLERFWIDAFPKNTVLMNKINRSCNGSPSTIYAASLVETLKSILKRFRDEILQRGTIGNVELIIDRNSHNSSVEFDNAIIKASGEKGLFKAVKYVTRIDSAACRLLQLADVVAYSRKWVEKKQLTAAILRDRFGIRVE
jgi:Protein of unknown function (DUF3800)